MGLIRQEQGFSLLETIISVFLVGLFLNGLFLAWTFMDDREKRLERYWNRKEEAEIAFEITQRTIREFAKSNILLNGDRISFTDVNGDNWIFQKNGTAYQKVFNGDIENLINNNCSYVNFSMTGKIVEIIIESTKPADWTNSNDLRLTGQALIRN